MQKKKLHVKFVSVYCPFLRFYKIILCTSLHASDECQITSHTFYFRYIKACRVFDFPAKNAQDRSFANAGDPTTCKDTPVVEKESVPVVGKPPSASRKLTNTSASSIVKSSTIPVLANDNIPDHEAIEKEREPNRFETPSLTNTDDQRRNEKHQQVSTNFR